MPVAISRKSVHHTVIKMRIIFISFLACFLCVSFFSTSIGLSELIASGIFQAYGLVTAAAREHHEQTCS